MIGSAWPTARLSAEHECFFASSLFSSLFLGPLHIPMVHPSVWGLAGALLGVGCTLVYQQWRLRPRRITAGAAAASGSADVPHMSPSEFVTNATEVVEWIGQYYRDLSLSYHDPSQAAVRYPVLSGAEPGYLARLLPDCAPENPEPWAAIFEDFKRLVMPGVCHWQSPRFFAYFPANSSMPGMMGEMLSAAINCIGFSWVASPACTELETIVMDWLAKLLGLSEAFLSSGRGGGVCIGTASESLFVALIAARRRVARHRAALASSSASAAADRTSHLDSVCEAELLGRLVAYGSTQTHSSFLKGCKVMGMDRARIRLLDVDKTTHALHPEDVLAAVEQDMAAGLVPFFICLTVGTTSTCAIDPVAEIAQSVRQLVPDIWIHVDAAYAGSAAVCPEFRHILRGVESADSFCFNPHKWLLVNFDFSAFWVTERSSLFDILSMTPEYLRNRWTESGFVTDYKDWQLPLGRRFRALKIWFVMRSYGQHGLQAWIRHCCKLAQRFEDQLREDPRFEIYVPRRFSLVCFRLQNEPRDRNQALVDTINSSGECFLIHSVVHDQFFLRFVVGSPQTTQADVDAAVQAIRCAADRIIPRSAVL